MLHGTILSDCDKCCGYFRAQACCLQTSCCWGAVVTQGIKGVLHTSTEGLSFPLQSSALVLSLSLKLQELRYLRDSCLFLELVAVGDGEV